MCGNAYEKEIKDEQVTYSCQYFAVGALQYGDGHHYTPSADQASGE